MLNLFQHPIESTAYETLNQVQGDKKAITAQSPKGEGIILDQPPSGALYSDLPMAVYGTGRSIPFDIAISPV